MAHVHDQKFNSPICELAVLLSPLPNAPYPLSRDPIIASYTVADVSFMIDTAQPAKPPQLPSASAPPWQTIDWKTNFDLTFERAAFS